MQASSRTAKFMGIYSVAAAMGSILLFSLLLLQKRLDYQIPGNAGMWIIVLHSYLLITGVPLGYRARATRPGRWGLLLSVGWIALLMIVVAAGFTGILFDLWQLRSR